MPDKKSLPSGEKPKRGRGRPKILLDPDEGERVGLLIPSDSTAGALLGVDPETFAARISDQPEFSRRFLLGNAKARARLSATQFEVACGYWYCPACGRPLRKPDPTPDDPDNVKPCPDHDKDYFVGARNGVQKPWKRWRGAHPIVAIFMGKQHLGQSDRSFLEQDFQRDLAKIPQGTLLELAIEAFTRLGKPLPADLVAEVRKGLNDREGGADARDERDG